MSVSAEAARRDDCLELREIEVADLLQCLGKSAIVVLSRFAPCRWQHGVSFPRIAAGRGRGG